MKQFLIRWANDAHNFRSPFLRRVNLSIATGLLALRSILFWAVSPLFPFLHALLGVLVALKETIAETPSLFVGQARYDLVEWKAHLAGFKAIWKSVK